LDEVVAGAASDSSFSSDDDMPTTDNDQEENSYGEEEEVDDGDSCDEELHELARPGPEADEVEDEVDRKAEEFIAKFRDQIRMQRIETPRRRPNSTPLHHLPVPWYDSGVRVCRVVQ
jgi:hypothetical protein